MNELEKLYKSNLAHDLVVAEKRDGEEGIRDTFRTYLKNYPSRKAWIQDVADQYMIDISGLHEASGENMNLKEQYTRLFNGKPRGNDEAMIQERLRLSDMSPEAQKLYRDGRDLFDRAFSLTKGRGKLVALIDDYIKYNPGFNKIDKRESRIVANTLANYAYENQ